MSDSASSAPFARASAAATTSTIQPACDCGATYGFLLLRTWLGMRAIIAGIEKFAGVRSKQVPLLDADGQPDISGATVEVKEKFYAFSNYQALPDALRDKLAEEPFMPAWMTTPFYAVLGWLLIALGVTLLLGLWTRLSLFAMGLLYTGLTLGLILMKQDAGIAWLAIHVGLVAYALHLSKYNRFALTRS